MDKKYSYVTLLTDDTYVYGIVLLAETMRRVDTKYPLLVLVTDEVSAASCELLHQLNIEYKFVETIPIPKGIHEHNMAISPRFGAMWRNSWTKFHIFNQTQFDKIVYLDADLMILKNIDHLFDKPHLTAAVDGEYYNIWPDWMHFNGGCMVIEPSYDLYIDILKFADNYDTANLPKQCFADQELLEQYFSDWPKQEDLHLNKYYNVFGPYMEEEYKDDIEENAYFIHFIGRKPWKFFIKPSQETYSEYFYQKAKSIIEEVLSTLDWELIRNKVVLSVYAICKNERHHVERWINSFSKADYVCVLDTGSTDGTWEYLQELAASDSKYKVGQAIINPWRFDAARNESMKLIPSETTMYFMADLDEVIKEEDWASKVKSVWTPLFNRGRYIYNRNVDENDNVIRAIEEYRVHSKDWYHWINVVHEALINHEGQKMFYIETCSPMDIVVWHYPDEVKQVDYAELCEEDLKEKPDDWVMRLQLAIEYEIKNEVEKAYNHFNYIITHQNNLQSFEIARSYYGVGKIIEDKGQPAIALNFFREGRLICPTDIDNYMAAAIIYFNKGDYKKSIELIQDALTNGTTAPWCGIYDVNSYYPFYIMALNYANLGELDRALGYTEMALQKTQHIDILELKQRLLGQIFKPQTLE